MKPLLLTLLLLLTSPALATQETTSILNPSGMPVPRYVSLKPDEVNLRVGPGKRYPTKVVYRRAQLPVKIIEEFAHWRKITDFEGTSGWVHKSMLDGKRTTIIIGKTQTLYRKPDPASPAALRAGAKVIGEVKRCTPEWCKLYIEGREGWIRKTDIWGVGPEEVLGE